MRLIDADKLPKYDGYALSATAVAQAVENAPTIEAEPRAAAHWIECLTTDHWKCSKCGDRAPIFWDGENMSYAEWLAPYCPSCGAKMDEEEK